ncbi:hypothetical protein DRQ36_08395 [bacterium]|nr:MAG: hypothetical protein DRQ36_08395 [bacterium]
MYFGRFEHKVDAKGRVQVPISLRRADMDKIYDRFVLVRGIGGCLALFTKEIFEGFVDAFDPEVLGDMGRVEFMRQFYSRIHDVELDSQGRVLLPRLLREEAGITDSALFLGAGKWVEIWDKNRYEEYTRSCELSYDDIARPFFGTLGRSKPEKRQDVLAE